MDAITQLEPVEYSVKNLESMPRTFSMIDLFAGCGGLSMGFEQEGFKPLLFSEINLNAAQTYMLNRQGEGIMPFGDIYSLTTLRFNICSAGSKAV